MTILITRKAVSVSPYNEYNTRSLPNNGCYYPQSYKSGDFALMNFTFHIFILKAITTNSMITTPIAIADNIPTSHFPFPSTEKHVIVEYES